MASREIYGKNLFDDQYREMLAAEKRAELRDRETPVGKRISWIAKIFRKFERKSPSLWQELWERERELLSPKVDVPQLEFYDPVADEARKSFFLPLGFVLALISLLAAGGVLLLFLNGHPRVQDSDKAITQKENRAGIKYVNNWKGSLQPGRIQAPAALTEDSGDIEVLAGSLSLNSKSGGKWQFSATALKGVFDFRSPVDLTIKHPFLDVNVKGTRFATDFMDNRGSLILCEGVLKISYKSPLQPDFERDIVMVAPARLIFDSKQISQRAFACPSDEQHAWRMVYLSDKSVHIAKFVQNSEREITMELLSGVKKSVPVGLIVHSRRF